jgi:hypothetical protein
MSLVSSWPWRSAVKQSDWAKQWGKKHVWCNHQVHRDFLITLYMQIVWVICCVLNIKHVVHTDTDLRSGYVMEGPKQVELPASRNWVQACMLPAIQDMYTKGVQFKSQLLNTGTWSAAVWHSPIVLLPNSIVLAASSHSAFFPAREKFEAPFRNSIPFPQKRSQNCEKGLLASSCLSVCLSVCPSAWNKSVTTGRIFMKFHIWIFFENLPRNFKFH